MSLDKDPDECLDNTNSRIFYITCAFSENPEEIAIFTLAISVYMARWLKIQ